MESKLSERFLPCNVMAGSSGRHGDGLLLRRGTVCRVLSCLLRTGARNVAPS